jgi:hypothetical protein
MFQEKLEEAENVRDHIKTIEDQLKEDIESYLDELHTIEPIKINKDTKAYDVYVNLLGLFIRHPKRGDNIKGGRGTCDAHALLFLEGTRFPLMVVRTGLVEFEFWTAYKCDVRGEIYELFEKVGGFNETVTGEGLKKELETALQHFLFFKKVHDK